MSVCMCVREREREKLFFKDVTLTFCVAGPLRAYLNVCVLSYLWVSLISCAHPCPLFG